MPEGLHKRVLIFVLPEKNKRGIMTYHTKLRDLTPDQKHLDLFRYKRIYSIHVSGL